jgi:uncharacterized membrane protein YedE/YeeE
LIVDASILSPGVGSSQQANGTVSAIAATLLGGGTLALAATVSWRQGALYLLGGVLGLSLYHALFGFTSAWRIFISDRRGVGLRAQMIMLAVAVVLFFPALAGGTLFGQPVHGEYGAVGVGMLTGAFLFGIGMQLGGGCASGTLYSAGGGNTRMLVTLTAFIAGSTVGAKDLPWWSRQPNIGSVSLIEKLGWMPALALSLAVMACIYFLTIRLERARYGDLAAGGLDASPRMATARAGTLAADRRRHRLGARQFCDAVPGRQAVGNHFGLGAVGV